MNAIVEITKLSGEVIFEKKFTEEINAHNFFEELEKLKSPITFETFTMNLSEWNDARTIGTVRVVALDDKQNRFVRRELYRKA